MGSIIYTSYNQQDSPTMWVNNQMVASFSNAPGDSGGPVMVYNGMSGSQVLYKLVGIIAGGNGTYGYFSPYQNIWNELGVIPYIE